MSSTFAIRLRGSGGPPRTVRSAPAALPHLAHICALLGMAARAAECSSPRDRSPPTMARRLTSDLVTAGPRAGASPRVPMSTRWWLLGVAVAAAGVLAAVAPPHGSIVALVVVVSTGACGVLAMVEQRDPRLGVRPVVAAIAVVFALAVAAPPRASNDLWSYAAYGRMV